MSIRKFQKYLGREFNIRTRKGIKAYLGRRLLRYEFMLKRARKNGLARRALAILFARTRELRVIYHDLFTGEDDYEKSDTEL